MLAALLLPLLTALTPAPTVVAAHAIPGAVVFDLDRGAQWTVAIDDDGAVIATTLDRGRDRAHHYASAAAAQLPGRLDRIDASADGTHVIVHGDGRAVAIALTPG